MTPVRPRIAPVSTPSRENENTPNGGGIPADELRTARKSIVDHRQYDAIHRSLLTGLLGNVGTRTGDFEYTGARGTKFHIFPGSGLFRGKPKWVVAGELVETTRLYARTVASIDPRWVERAADHLVKREYSEPHWRRDTANVVAYERVALYGLVLVPRRVVYYGPIDPKTAREVFIHAALVEGEYDTDAQYFRHNRDLLREIELIEAKLRRRDVLVDAKTRFAFYDARVPQGVFNGFTFERWRRDAEQRDKRVLFMNRADLMLHAAEQATPGLYPDSLTVHGAKLPLSYHLEPGHPADGVTATVPLAALNQLPTEPFEWLVPGMLKEKLVGLIKTMPREWRVKFVPAPDVADAVMPNLVPYHGSLLDAFADQLGKRAGMQIPRSAFTPDELPEHLRMNFRVVDEHGKQVVINRDLNVIRRELGIRARSTFADLPPGEFNRQRVTRWDFGDLPEKVEVHLHGTTLLGFPALIDGGDHVALRLLDSAEASRKAHPAGVRRLFMVQLSEEVKHLARRLPRIEQLCLYFKPLGSCDDLKRDLMDAIADRATGELTGVRTQAEFIAHAETGWRRLSQAATQLTELAWEALSAYHAVERDLSGRAFPPLLLDSVRDMRDQLAHLMSPRFLKTTPAAWLSHLPRFLKAIQVRLTKLMNAGLSRDVAHAQEVAPRWRAYLERARKHRKDNVIDPALEEYRWMLEELRVSLFAQELKTSVPVSPKRLDALWEKVLP
jgi:ATP-dependent helicase HrpA